MKRIYCLAAFVYLAAFGCMADSSPSGMIVPTEQIGRVLHQCSRQTPSAVEGTWLVPRAIATQLDRDLPGLAIQSIRNGEAPLNWQPVQSIRQYAGVIIAGRRYVYINAGPASRSRHADTYSGPIMVCDGGAAFWGALYDPQSHQLLQIHFNGVA